LDLKREKGGGDWGKLRNGELHNWCTSPNVIRMIKLRRMIVAGHVARMHRKYCSEDLKGRNYSEDLEVDGRILLKWFLEK
jgi:hypothetical protein